MRSKWISADNPVIGSRHDAGIAARRGAGNKGQRRSVHGREDRQAGGLRAGTYTTFDIPFAKLPGGRMNAKGELDPTSSPKDAHDGAFVAAKKLGLFRNFEWVHWIPTAPSKKDPATGKWSGGDLDGFPTGWGSTGLGIAGDCLYWGRSNSTNTTGPRVTRDVKIFKIQPNPEKNPPVEVGTMPQLTVDNGKTAVRDRELRPYNYTSTDGVERMLMVRSAATGTGGDVITYTLDPKTCLPTDKGCDSQGRARARVLSVARPAELQSPAGAVADLRLAGRGSDHHRDHRREDRRGAEGSGVPRLLHARRTSAARSATSVRTHRPLRVRPIRRLQRADRPVGPTGRLAASAW